MKKKLKGILILVLLTITSFAFVACNYNNYRELEELKEHISQLELKLASYREWLYGDKQFCKNFSIDFNIAIEEFRQRLDGYIFENPEELFAWTMENFGSSAYQHRIFYNAQSYGWR